MTSEGATFISCCAWLFDNKPELLVCSTFNRIFVIYSLALALQAKKKVRKNKKQWGLL
jgi:hypothetical protein